MDINHVHISNGVSKLGAYIPSVSLPPVLTCRPDAPCFDKCYARKGRFRFPKIKELLQHNLNMWLEKPEVFEQDVFEASFYSKFFRWHPAGDIPNKKYFEMMVRVADKSEGTEYLCFTKKFDLINNYLDSGFIIPNNLHIVFSAWGEFLPNNPYNLPVSYVKFKDDSIDCHIPEDAFTCSNFCGECVMSGHSCWKLTAGQSVYFNEH